MSALDFVRVARAAGARLSADGASLVVEAEDPLPPQVFDMLRAHKPEILELLHAEHRDVVRYVNEQFRSSPLGQCAHCGGGSPSDVCFVALFVGENRADIHASCHPAWIAAQEAKARVALGIEAQVGDGAVKEEHARAGRERG
jgi:hypothetical protein